MKLGRAVDESCHRCHGGKGESGTSRQRIAIVSWNGIRDVILLVLVVISSSATVFVVKLSKQMNDIEDRYQYERTQTYQSIDELKGECRELSSRLRGGELSDKDVAYNFHQVRYTRAWKYLSMANSEQWTVKFNRSKCKLNPFRRDSTVMDSSNADGVVTWDIPLTFSTLRWCHICVVTNSDEVFATKRIQNNASKRTISLHYTPIGRRCDPACESR